MAEVLANPTLPESVDVMARTLFGEASGCGVSAMQHVAMVIMNRVNHPKWWGHDVISVCQEPWQFSCWNKSDPNRARILAATEADGWFAVAVSIAYKAIGGNLPDVTDDADSYYALSMAHPPAWASRGTKTFSDQWHAFYRLENPLPGVKPEDPHAPTVSVHSIAAPTPDPAPAEDPADALDAEYNK